MARRWNELKERKLKKKRGPVAFVLSGGGPMGAVQVGMLTALMERGIVPDALVGTSVGALNAVFLANDPTTEGVRRLHEVWSHMRRDDLFPGGRLVSAWHVLKRGSYVFSNAGLRRILQAELGDVDTFEALKLPVNLNATNMDTGEEVWFNSGPLLDPLLASAAMPGVFPPVTIGDATYIDGGVANNVPLSRAVEIGAKQIYVINVNASAQKRALSRPYDFMMHGFVLARAHRYRGDIVRYQQQAQIIEMPVADVGHVAFTNMSQTDRLIEAGYETATHFLDHGPQVEPVLTTSEAG